MQNNKGGFLSLQYVMLLIVGNEKGNIKGLIKSIIWNCSVTLVATLGNYNMVNMVDMPRSMFETKKKNSSELIFQ